MIKSFTYSAEESGPRLLILGAVHGNEICGTQAIRRVMEEMDSGKLRLTRGHVEFVPIANPRAYRAAGGKAEYCMSTLRVEVGVGWLVNQVTGQGNT
jgi:predicted deacylase